MQKNICRDQDFFTGDKYLLQSNKSSGKYHKQSHKEKYIMIKTRIIEEKIDISEVQTDERYRPPVADTLILELITQSYTKYKEYRDDASFREDI